MLSKFLISIFYNRILILEMARRDLKNRYAGSYLGIFWTVIVPLLSSVVYIFVFGFLIRGGLQGEYEDVSFTVFYFLGFEYDILNQEWTYSNRISIDQNNTLDFFVYNQIFFCWFHFLFHRNGICVLPSNHLSGNIFSIWLIYLLVLIRKKSNITTVIIMKMEN